jgi:hypothetical protein
MNSPKPHEIDALPGNEADGRGRSDAPIGRLASTVLPSRAPRGRRAKVL